MVWCQTEEAVYTLSAMTAGIRRNWIQAVMKNVRPSTAPDVARSVYCSNALYTSYYKSSGSLLSFLPNTVSTVHSEKKQRLLHKTGLQRNDSNKTKQWHKQRQCTALICVMQHVAGRAEM